MNKYINELSFVIEGIGKKLTKDFIVKTLLSHSPRRIDSKKVKRLIDHMIRYQLNYYVEDKVYHLHNIGNNNEWKVKLTETDELVGTLWITEEIYGSGVIIGLNDESNKSLGIKLKIHEDWVSFYFNEERKYYNQF